MTLRAFDDYALAEASLHRDVLQARAGLLRNYDSLNGAAQAMEDAVARLRSHAQTQRLDIGPVDRLAAAVVQQEELMERFKTSNALRQNSLSYVGLLSTSPAFRAQDAQIAQATDALAARFSISRATHLTTPSRRFSSRSSGLQSKRPLLDRTRKQHGRCWRMLVCCMTSYPRSMRP
jgi:hypothetical protein